METRLVEIRTYRLQPGGAAEFHRLVVEESVPLLEKWGTDVVAYGPSVTEPDSYFLIRCYANAEELENSQDGFYASDAWRQGPRQQVIDLIESTTGAAFLLSSEGIEALRKV